MLIKTANKKIKTLLSKLSDIATYLEEAGFTDSAKKVKDAMDAIDGSLEDYTLDTAGSPPDNQMNYLGTGHYEMTGEIGSGSQNILSLPAAEKMACLANKLDQSGNYDEADAIDDILEAIIKGYKTDEKLKPDQRKLKRRKQKRKNEDTLVGVNGLDETGATQNQFQGLTDSWFYQGYGNLGAAYK